jgi:hypothetical protein
MKANAVTPIYLSTLGFTSRRPDGFPPLDRPALMRHAHQFAKRFRGHYPDYREALAYGLKAAWIQAKSIRTINSLAIQAGTPSILHTAAQIAASRRTTHRLSSFT